MTAKSAKPAKPAKPAAKPEPAKTTKAAPARAADAKRPAANAAAQAGPKVGSGGSGSSGGSNSRPSGVRPTIPTVPPPAASVSDASRPKKGQAGLSAKELEHFRDLLLEKRRELVGDMSSMEREALRTSGGSNLSTLPIHMADMGTDNYEQEFTLGLVEKDRNLAPRDQQRPGQDPERHLRPLRRHGQADRQGPSRSPAVGPLLHRARPEHGKGNGAVLSSSHPKCGFTTEITENTEESG